MNRQHLISIALVVVLGGIFFVCWKKSGVQNGPSAVNETAQSITPLDSVLIADADATRELGLGQRESLPTDTGMLFVFEKPQQYGFWMKDMKFSLDIIWLDGDLRVVDLKKNISPLTYPEIFTPSQKSKYVLEVNAGIAEKNNYTEGAVLGFLKSYLHMK